MLSLLAASGVLVVGLLTDPVSLDPHRASDLVSAAIVENVCEPLVRERADGSSFEGVLATTWATHDGRTWTFTLREDVRFHDGTPLDADAVVANLDWLREHRGFQGAAVRIGPHAVSITLRQANSALLATLSQPFFALQSPRALGSGRSIGTGPFRLTLARPGRIEIEANAEHWDREPELASVVFRRFPSERALATALLEGGVDVTTALTQEQANRLGSHDEIRLDVRTGLNITLLSLNTDHPMLSDRRVRRAIARAVDRNSIVASILAGYGEPAHNPLPPSSWAYARRTRELVRDTSAARQLLEQAGMAEGFEVSLLTVDASRPYLPDPVALAERLQGDLAAIGVRARIERAGSWAEYVDRGRRGAYEMAVFGWQADTTDPNDFLSALLASESIGTTNRSRYRSPDMDALLKLGRRVSTLSERTSVYERAQELFQRDMPWVPLYHVSVFTAARHDVEGLMAGPTGLLHYATAHRAGPANAP
jgi:peptide/nickel transport system substrate-binding protein